MKVQVNIFLRENQTKIGSFITSAKDIRNAFVMKVNRKVNY